MKALKAKKFIANILFLICFAVYALHMNPTLDFYPIRGIDVSRYQGTINWSEIYEQGYKFTFIKATEGSSHVDPCFSTNWQNVAATPILASAYHFFSYDSSGITQAENYISTVGKRSGMLPPAIDIEFYGEYYKKPKDTKEAQNILRDLISELEKYYGVKPILYATHKSYNLYIRGSFSDYPIWIRNTYYPPMLDFIPNWDFWQYTDKGKIAGHESDYIDLNVFCGSIEDLKAFAL